MSDLPMPQVRFPFRLKDAFFTSVRCERRPDVPKNLELPFSAQIKVVDKNFPDLEVFLKVRTDGQEAPVKIRTELIGLFGPIEGQPVPERSVLPAFLNERAMFMLWPYVHQMIRTLTAHMGMQPLNIVTPYLYNILEKQSVEAPGTESS